MKHVKQILAGLLVLVVAAGASVPVGATDITSPGTVNGVGDYTFDVGLIYQPATGGDIKLSVDVAWEAMTFTYTESWEGNWNPNTHTYQGGWQGAWSTNQSSITVTNHSNIGIEASFAFSGTVAGVEGTFTQKTMVIASADADAYRTADPETGVYPAPFGTTDFGIASTSAAITTEQPTLGTITVSLQQVRFVYTEEELVAAVKAIKETGGKILLGADINVGALSCALSATPPSPVVIDLGGHTLTGNIRLDCANVVIQNGRLEYTLDGLPNYSKSAVYAMDTTLTLTDVEIAATGIYALAHSGNGTTTCERVTLTGGLNSTSTGGQSQMVTICLMDDGLRFRDRVTVSNLLDVKSSQVCLILTANGTYEINGRTFAPSATEGDLRIFNDRTYQDLYVQN